MSNRADRQTFGNGIRISYQMIFTDPVGMTKIVHLMYSFASHIDNFEIQFKQIAAWIDMKGIVSDDDSTGLTNTRSNWVYQTSQFTWCW